jgi:hypothetical protein
MTRNSSSKPFFDAAGWLCYFFRESTVHYQVHYNGWIKGWLTGYAENDYTLIDAGQIHIIIIVYTDRHHCLSAIAALVLRVNIM